MKALRLIPLVLIALICYPSLAQKTPQFKDYPASSPYRGKNHPLVMDKFGKQFRTRLRYAIKHGKPTFAGHYIVTGWGCGTSGCNTGAIIDAKTGKAYPFPVAIASVFPLKAQYIGEAGQEQIYKLNSRLMIFAGELETINGNGHDVVEFYEFDGTQFNYLATKPYGRRKETP